MKIKGSKNIRVRQDGDNVYVGSNVVATPVTVPPLGETDSELVDFTTGSGLSPEQYTTWERAVGDVAEKGVKIKVITRTFYDKDTDKNYNYCLTLTYSNGGQLLKVEGESQEVAFETTLHEHPIV